MRVAFVRGDLVCDVLHPSVVMVVEDSFVDPERGPLHQIRCGSLWQVQELLPLEPAPAGLTGPWLREERLALWVPPLGQMLLAELPLPVLACVLAHLPIGNASQLARLSRRFRAAFDDETVWLKRCMALFNKANATTASWKTFFQLHSLLCIRIVVFSVSWGRLNIEKDLTTHVPLFMTVFAFLRHVAAQTSSGDDLPLLMPFDPRRVWWVGPDSQGPNCTWMPRHSSQTIWEAGLRDGSALQHHVLTTN